MSVLVRLAHHGPLTPLYRVSGSGTLGKNRCQPGGFGSQVALPTACMGISLCMIVKNEQDWLEGAVRSVRSIVSEVIIVDTGSSDSTLERSQSLADKALKFRWTDSFAEARNASLAEAKEPWILVLDADERIASKDLPLIVQASNSAAADG